MIIKGNAESYLSVGNFTFVKRKAIGIESDFDIQREASYKGRKLIYEVEVIYTNDIKIKRNLPLITNITKNRYITIHEFTKGFPIN